MSEAEGKSVAVRPKGSPAFLIMLVVILGLSFLAGSLAGAGGASIIGGFVALFSLLATMGGPLRADLRRFAAIGPLVAFSTIAPRLLAEVSIAGAFALIVILVFAGGLLPIRAKRYDGVALGVGMGALLGYSMSLTGRADARQLIIAGLAGLLVALVLRLLLGVADPSGPTRKAVAGLLDESSSDFSAAFEMWLSDRPARWLGTVLVAAGRYRLARRVLSAGTDADSDPALISVLDAAADRGKTTAAAVAAKKPPSRDAATPLAAAPDTADPLRADAAATMIAALNDADRAADERDGGRVPIPAGFRRTLSFTAVQAGLRHGSVQVRHAARAAVAVLIALLISLLLPPGDPLLPTLLVTTFAIVQSSWRATISRARDRFIGLIAGGILVVLIVLVVPEFLLLPISLIGLAVGLWFITARPAIGTAGIIVMSVGLNSEIRNLEPLAVIAEYVILTLLALVIGVVLGFVVVPAWRPPALAIRADSAVALSAALLRHLADGTSADSPAPGLRSLGDAQAATQQLIPDREKLTTAQQDSLEHLRIGLQDLVVTALFVASARPAETRSSALRNAADVLDARDQTPAAESDTNPLQDALSILATDIAQQHSRLNESLRR